MKETKRVWKFFQYRECDAFALYLEKMALEGWHLETVGLGMTFKKGEPKTVRYEIEVFSKATEYDTKAEPAAEEFSDYCETAGWEFVCAYRKFCIYRTEDAEVVPIETDEMQRFENISKASMSYKRSSFLYPLLLCVLDLPTFSVYKLLYTQLLLMRLFIWGMAICAFPVLVEEFFWRYKSDKRLMAGGSISYGKENIFTKLIRIIPPILLNCVILSLAIWEKEYSVFIIIIAILMFAGFLCMMRIKLKLSRENSYVISFAITFIIFFIGASISISRARTPVEETERQDFSNVAIPLYTYELTGGENKEDKLNLFEYRENFLGSMQAYDIQNTTHPEEKVSYKIIESKYKWILQRFWDEELHPRYVRERTDFDDYYTISSEEAQKWGAISYVQFDYFYDNYLILYPNRLIVFQYDGEITPEIIEKVKNLKIEK